MFHYVPNNKSGFEVADYDYAITVPQIHSRNDLESPLNRFICLECFLIVRKIFLKTRRAPPAGRLIDNTYCQQQHCFWVGQLLWKVAVTIITTIADFHNWHNDCFICNYLLRLTAISAPKNQYREKLEQ
jgi:hypothetical protein